jgi:hypothetical protein
MRDYPDSAPATNYTPPGPDDGVSDNPYCNDADCNEPNSRAMRWHNELRVGEEACVPLNRNADGTLSTPGDNELRALRLWHWQKAMDYRRKANDQRASNYSRKCHNANADMHIKAVQALNDVVSGTAEQDDIRSRG